MILIIHIALLLFLLLLSNPFARLLPIAPLEGQDLNPLLQDWAMIIHPPLLYMGYVGFAIPFAMVLAAWITNEQGAHMLRLLKQFSLMAWAFLTLGITLGSFWAYYELGWGGFWFWDPVENASVIPWCLATAWVHSLRRRRPVQENGLLIIWTFIAVLLGTFLVRSGLLSSVHSFASDPSRGFFILGIIIVAACGSQYIYFKQSFPRDQRMVLGSRESFLLINQLLFVLAASIIFLGTLYPLILETFHMGFISVGPAYFNTLLIPLGCIILLLIGLSAFSVYGHTLRHKKSIFIALLSAVIGGMALYRFPLSVIFTGSACVWIVITAMMDLFRRRNSVSVWPMHLAHLGMGVMALGIAISQTMGFQKEMTLHINGALSTATRGFDIEGCD